MSEDATSPPARPQNGFHGPRVFFGMVLFAPAGIYWAAKAPTLSKPAKWLLIVVGAILLFGQMSIAMVGVVLVASHYMPPWWTHTAGTFFISLGVALAVIDMVCRKVSRAMVAWVGSSMAVIIICMCVFVLIARPLELINGLAFRIPVVSMMQEMLDDPAAYPIAGRDTLIVPPMELAAADLPNEDRERFELAGCEITVPLEGESRYSAGAGRSFETEYGDLVYVSEDAYPLRETLDGLPPRQRQRMAGLFDFRHDLAQDRIAFNTTYADIRAARNLRELVEAETLYTYKLMSLPESPTQAYEGPHSQGFVHMTEQRIIALVYGPVGERRLGVRLSFHELQDAEEAEAMARRILKAIHCPPRTSAPSGVSGESFSPLLSE